MALANTVARSDSSPAQQILPISGCHLCVEYNSCVTLLRSQIDGNKVRADVNAPSVLCLQEKLQSRKIFDHRSYATKGPESWLMV